MRGRLLLLMLLIPVIANAAEGETIDLAPIDQRDRISIQRGARIFVNYCLSCHTASYMRYSQLKTLGLTEQQIRQYLVPAGQRVGDTMTVAMKPDDAKEWFGVVPPDLTVIARARGVDWLFTYLRSFYRDDTRPTGWNNTLVPGVAMPHVLYRLQGEQVLQGRTTGNEAGEQAASAKLVLTRPGTLPAAEYATVVADLVNYLAFMAEPMRAKRIQTGIVVLFYLVILFLLAYLLKQSFWSSVK